MGRGGLRRAALLRVGGAAGECEHGGLEFGAGHGMRTTRLAPPAAGHFVSGSGIATTLQGMWMRRAAQPCGRHRLPVRPAPPAKSGCSSNVGWARLGHPSAAHPSHNPNLAGATTSPAAPPRPARDDPRRPGGPEGGPRLGPRDAGWPAGRGPARGRRRLTGVISSGL